MPPGGLLFEWRTELQLWASYRGQLLARTVKGMMAYERAMRLLVRIEYPAPLGECRGMQESLLQLSSVIAAS